MAAPDQRHAERLDDGRLADSGTPVIPTCTALPAAGISSSSNCCARSRWSARVDSTNVIARGSADRSPARTAAASSSIRRRCQLPCG